MNRHSPDTLPRALERLTAALEDEPAAFAFLHGSAAEGLPFRDLDVGVYLHGAVSDPLRTSLELADRLERAVGIPVDVHVLNSTPAGFAFFVNRGQLLLCRDEQALGDWRERVYREYFDLQPRWEHCG